MDTNLVISDGTVLVPRFLWKGLVLFALLCLTRDNHLWLRDKPMWRVWVSLHHQNALGYLGHITHPTCPPLMMPWVLGGAFKQTPNTNPDINDQNFNSDQCPSKKRISSDPQLDLPLHEFLSGFWQKQLLSFQCECFPSPHPQPGWKQNRQDFFGPLLFLRGEYKFSFWMNFHWHNSRQPRIRSHSGKLHLMCSRNTREKRLAVVVSFDEPEHQWSRRVIENSVQHFPLKWIWTEQHAPPATLSTVNPVTEQKKQQWGRTFLKEMANTPKDLSCWNRKLKYKHIVNKFHSLNDNTGTNLRRYTFCPTNSVGCGASATRGWTNPCLRPSLEEISQ